MIRGIFVVALLCAACASAPAAKAPDAPPPSHAIAFLHAAVVPMDSDRILRDQTVVVVGGEIVALGPASAVKVPAGAVQVDAKGRYLLPALCDMHVHLLGEAWNMMLPPGVRAAAKDIPQESFLFPYVATGVTTVQAMSATPEELTLRDRIASGKLLGPRLILARMIDGPKKAWPPPLATWVDSGPEARAAVQRAKADGYDKIKVYSFLSKESYDAIILTAREQGMDVIGHIPMSLSLEYVLDAGQKLIAHSEEVGKHAGGDYSAKHIDELATLMVDRGVWMTPTLVTTRSIIELFDDRDALLGRPEAAYFRHPMELGVWQFLSQNIYGPIPAQVQTKIRVAFDQFQKPLARSFFAKGGKMMTGTDSLFPGLVPGFALHRELRELVAVGLTPYEALRTSTTAPFEYLGEKNRGTIAVGQQSDLLLVDANPLEDVSAASKIAGVLIQGRWVGADEIHRAMQALLR